MKLAPSPVAIAAVALGLPIQSPESLKSPEAVAALASAQPEILVVAAYGLILPSQVLAIPARGCLNIHASLLPRWRGAAPIQRALLAGDAETGVGIMVMEPGLDTGPVLLERRLPILPDDTAGSLTHKLANLGAEAIVDALGALDTLVARPQDALAATYAAKVEKAEALVDWTADAGHLDRQIRAFDPFPGAETRLNGEALKIWAAKCVDVSGLPGTVVSLLGGCPVVACGSRALALTILQRPGSQRLQAAEFLKARPIPIGTVLGKQ
jgi:methionyl-tRNA formyltransferase